ncbi:MAG: SAM-dependent methyltransferase, partial [Ruminococcaceae bacterium]|nr:SAM-dependent methyltransferase [Oscillospiraceae bacterium]
MSYIKDNKAAWEEAFEHRLENWGDDNHKRLLNETLPFFDANVAAELQKLDFAGKTVA